MSHSRTGRKLVTAHDRRRPRRLGVRRLQQRRARSSRSAGWPRWRARSRSRARTASAASSRRSAPSARSSTTATGQFEGMEIQLLKEGSDATPAVALEKAKKLIEQDNVDILIGPLSGDEGLAVKDYAKTVPDKTFVNGSSAAQDTTMRDPAPNFFRFSTDGAQWQAGLGKEAFDKKGYKNVALVAEDYSFPYTQVARLHVRVLRGRRPRGPEELGAARHQGLQLGRLEPADVRHRRDLRRARRQRRRQLLHPVPAGRRQGEVHRRVHHRGPDGARDRRRLRRTPWSARSRPARPRTTRPTRPGATMSPRTTSSSPTACRTRACSR